MIRTEVLSNPSEAAHLTEEWARLAHDCARPYCNPEWMLAWWAHVAPRTARLNVVAVHDDDRLVGLAPFYFHSTGRGGRYRLLATGTSLRGDVLAVPGLERAVARAVAAAIGGSSPVALEGIAAASPFVGLLEGQGPGAAVTEWSIRAPVLRLEGRPFDQWLAGKSANFRQQMRRARTQLEKRGARFRVTTTREELTGDLRAFASLHRARWERRGGSRVLSPEVEAMLADAGAAMVGDGRFRLWSLEVDDRAVSSHLFLAAGGEVSYWLGGFDDEWAAQKPSMQVLLAALEDAWSRGDIRMDLGGGGQDYKYRFTDDDERLDWVALLPPGWRRPLRRAAIVAVRARRAALSKLSPRLQARARALARRD